MCTAPAACCAAGPGAGLCNENGTLTPRLDQAGEAASGTSFILLGLQCVHKGMVEVGTNQGIPETLNGWHAWDRTWLTQCC